jgi:hypothetical protein
MDSAWDETPLYYGVVHKNPHKQIKVLQKIIRNGYNEMARMQSELDAMERQLAEADERGISRNTEKLLIDKGALQAMQKACIGVRALIESVLPDIHPYDREMLIQKWITDRIKSQSH